MTSLSAKHSLRFAFVARGVALAKRVGVGLLHVVRARTHRREVTELLRLDDRMLKDIGLVRSDVLRALAEPATVDPSVSLRLRSVEGRSRQHTRADQVARMSRSRSDPFNGEFEGTYRRAA